MNYLTVENLSKAYGDKLLFENVTFGIDAGQKLAMIARNGSGKTTLLSIIAGQVMPDEGQVVLRGGIKVAYLPQLPDLDDDLTVLDQLLISENDFFRAIKNYEEALHEVAKEHSDEAEQKLTKAINRMDSVGAWDYESKIKEVLGKLGISDVHQVIGALSGGQKRKIALAQALIEEADLLIMDEPTNHLDIDMIEWLEGFLNKRNISLLLVSHDRFFMDAVCDGFIELEVDGIAHYKGDYEYYLTKKAEREELRRTESEKAKNLLRKELEWLRRSPMARTTKSKYRIDAAHALKDKARYHAESDMPDFDLKMSRMGKKILELQHIHKSFGEKEVIKDFSYTFKKGERIGIVGPNGAGKSTFFRLIMGELQPSPGKVVRGSSMVFGYFSQQGANIRDDQRVIDAVKEVAEEIPMGKSSTFSPANFLRYFHFDDTTQYNYYGNLSGGEKRRLHLLLTLVNNPNFLILDEPTNDLDIPTMHTLEHFLEHYQGCLLVATHDRAFLDKLVDHIFVFKGNGEIKDFPFTYSEYKDKEKKEQKAEQKREKESKPVVKREKTNKKPSYKYVREYEQLTTEIEEMEQARETLLQKMNSGEAGVEELQKLGREFEELDASLDEKSMRWLELAEMMGE